jgi:hypothetical protein
VCGGSYIPFTTSNKEVFTIGAGAVTSHQTSALQKMDFWAIIVYILSIIEVLFGPQKPAVVEDACRTPFGSPCGPAAVCFKDPSVKEGYNCQSIVPGCPAGCGPSEVCQGDACACKAGFYRPIKHIPCIPLGKTAKVEKRPNSSVARIVFQDRTK